MSNLNTPWCLPADINNRLTALAQPTISDQTVLTSAALQASEVLYAASGRQFPGPATETVRPLGRPSSMTYRQWTQYLRSLSGDYAYDWVTSGGWYADDYPDVSRLDMGRWPIRSIGTVEIDGVVIPAAEYRVDDYRYLVRQPSADGSYTAVAGWPRYQNLAIRDGDPGSFLVTLTWGDDPPETGKNACITLALEFAKMYTGAQNRLPSRVQSITRQGVSFSILDPMQFLDEGLTGLYDVDLFVRSVNPGKQRVPAVVWSPDMPRQVRSNTTYP